MFTCLAIKEKLCFNNCQTYSSISDKISEEYNYTFEPNTSLALTSKEGIIPIKIIYSKRLYNNGETLPFIVYTEVAPHNNIYIEFYFKTPVGVNTDG